MSELLKVTHDYDIGHEKFQPGKVIDLPFGDEIHKAIVMKVHKIVHSSDEQENFAVVLFELFWELGKQKAVAYKHDFDSKKPYAMICERLAKSIENGTYRGMGI